MPHPTDHSRVVGLDFHPSAASVALLAPPQLAIERLNRNGDTGRQACQRRDQAFAVRFSGCLESKHGKSYVTRCRERDATRAGRTPSQKETSYGALPVARTVRIENDRVGNQPAVFAMHEVTFDMIALIVGPTHCGRNAAVVIEMLPARSAYSTKSCPRRSLHRRCTVK